MKKLLALLLCICIAMAAAGCAAQQAPDDTAPPTYEGPNVVIDSPTEPYHPEDLSQPMHAIFLPKVREAVLADDGTELFTLSFQKTQLILNGTDIEEVIVGNLQSRMNGILSSAAEIEAQAREDYPQFEYWNSYFIDITYTPTRIDQAVLSLFGNLSTYSGGTHPMLITESVTYDIETGSVLTLGDIVSEDCTGEALSTLILESLAPMNSELYYDYDVVVKDQFSSNFTSISQWYFSRTGLCFHFSPYEIAPYSSGTIIAEIPYHKLEGILLQKYMPVTIMDATGSMYAEMYLDDDAERFAFTAEVELTEEGSEILLYSDDTVTDVRIESGTWYTDGSQYIANSTVFAADAIGIGNAIKLTADLLDESTALRLIYCSDDQEVSAFIMYDETGDSILLAHG